MRTIEIKETVELAFAYRADANVLRENATTVVVKADLSKLSADDLLEWAYSAMVVSYQSKLRSAKPPVCEKAPKLDAEGNAVLDYKGQPVLVDVPNTYAWAVPSRGTRSTADPKKLEEAASKLIGKMDDSAKKELMYNMLIGMGKTEVEALTISGYTKPAVA